MEKKTSRVLLLGRPCPWSGDTICAAASGRNTSTAAATAAKAGRPVMAVLHDPGCSYGAQGGADGWVRHGSEGWARGPSWLVPVLSVGAVRCAVR